MPKLKCLLTNKVYFKGRLVAVGTEGEHLQTQCAVVQSG